MSRKIILAIIILLLLYTHAFSQEESKALETLQLSLSQARTHALENNVNVKNAKLDVLIAKKK